MKRLFIAIKITLDENFIEKLDNIHFHLKKEIIKWVDINQLHLTLQFLGDTEEHLINDIIENLNKLQLQVKSFKLTLRGLGVFTNIHNPKVLWIGIEKIDKLNLLKEMVDKNLIDFDFKFKNEKEFKPHLTIARIKKIFNKNKLKNTLEYNQDSFFQNVTVNKVILYESILTPEKPIYKNLFEVSLR